MTLDEQLDRIKRQYEWKHGMPLTPPPIPVLRKSPYRRETVILVAVMVVLTIITAATVIEKGW